MEKQPFPSDQQDKFMLRLPAGMRDRIRAAADANNRSMNAEIVSRLDDSLEERQHAASLTLSVDLAEISAADLKEKLGLLALHLKDFKIKATNSATEFLAEEEPDEDYA